jgi:carboxyl-terminal processing protease
MHLSRSGFVALLTLLTALGTAPAQEAESVREVQVQEVLEACKGADAARIWSFSDKLVALGKPSKRAIRKSLANASVEGKLAGLRALIELDSPTFAVEYLMELAADEDIAVSHRVMALDLVGKTEEIDAEDGLVELLVTYNPQMRIAAARALWRLDGEQSHKAKQALVEFLRSADPELRAEGALALAEMGDITTPGVRRILLELRKEPGARGKLADALYAKLQLQKVIAFYERRGDAKAADTRRKGPWRHLDEMVRVLKRYYDTDEELDERVLRLRAAGGLVDFPDDPHTTFLTPEQYKEFMHGADGVDPSYGGIGAFINVNVKDRFEILRPIFGGPAWNAKIRGGDIIVAVDGKPIAGLSNTEIIKRIKGPAGTPVILTIIRNGRRETKDVKVIRAKIVLPTVQARMMPGKIGYVSIAQYSYDTGRELWEALMKLEGAGMRGLVIDLRDNPGGLLESVKICLTLFLKEKQLICTVKGREYKKEEHFSFRADRARNYPISVLVNRISASGAELMSGVMQHYSKASEKAEAEQPHLDVLVLGQSTFGKGTVQHTRPLETWPGEKFTDQPRKNGRYNFPERFQDQNGNRRWDEGEPFTDEASRNRRWDDAEPWEDQNGNGKRDEGEKFTDENKDGTWNDKEPFEDANGNQQYDYGAALKLTVARYYLPGGGNFTRKRVWDAKENKYVFSGGVRPDIEVENHRWTAAHLVELRELQDEGKFIEYAKRHWEADQATLKELAHFDGRDPARYPGFDEFYKSLKTRLSRQEVRLALRIAVRREVMARSGKEIIGDLSDDRQLLRGVTEVLKRLGDDPNAIPEYKALHENGEAAKAK